MAKKKKKGLQVVGNIDFKDDKNGLKVVGKVDFDDNNNITNKTAFIQQQDIAPVKQTGFFNDAKGSTLQKIGNTAVDATGNILKGGFSSLEGLADFGRYRGADVLDFFGANKKAKKVRETAKANTTEEIFSSINHILSGDLAGKVNENDLAAFKDIKEGSYLGDKGSQVFQGVGNSATNAALSALGGNVGGMTSLFMSAAGNAQSEAYQEGATDFQAGIYGALSGSVEAATEMMFGGLGKITQNLGFGTGALDDQLINRFTRKLSNTIAKNAVDLGLRSAGEGVEEVVAGFGNAILQKLTYMKDEDFSKLLKDQKLMDSFVSGALSSALMQAPTTLSATMQGRESSTGYTENEREVYNRELENRLNAEEKLTKRRRTQIEEQLNQDFERGYVNAQNIRDILGDKIDLQKDTRLAESFNEETRRTQAYENDVSKYDEKQAKVIQTAIDSGLLNNSNKTHDMVDLIAKLSADKGVDFDFTNNERIKDSGFAIDGRQVNGFVKDGTVNLNLESNQVLNKTVGHEITHVLEGTELYDNLQQSLKAYIGEKEWNNRISQLEKVYQNVKGANIENELTSDLVGEHIFNDENFIRNLSTKNPNLFQKIFDEIKYMVKIATAGSKEARDLEKVKRAFEKAYRETSKTQEGTQYSINQLTDDGITMTYVRNPNSNASQYKNLNQDFGQDLEPSGEYMSMDTMEGKNKIDGYEYGTIQFKNPLVIDNEDTTSKGWKKELSDRYNGLTGKELSNAIMQDGYDAVMSRDNKGNIVEVVNLNGTKQNNQNTKYSLTQDSQGRELSKEQQEYFKNSKVRDKDGRLIEVYHGTPNSGFTIYDSNRLGETSGADDTYLGFHLTDNIELASFFSGIVNDDVYNQAKQQVEAKYDINEDSVVPFQEMAQINQEIRETAEQMAKEQGEVKHQYINIEKPLSVFADYGISEEQLANDLVYAATGERDISNVSDYFDNNEEFLSAIQQNFDNELAGLKDELAKPESIKRIKELGYDGLILPMTKTDQATIKGTGNEYITFDSNQIKNTDNTTPTSNQDIRYSLTDNQGRQLSEQQQEFFKDSKVRDENGNLKVMYHGTPDTNFTIFENNRANSGAGLKGLTNKGFYFTDTKLGAEQYAIPRGERGIGETPGVKEVYLNMTNPLVVDSVSKEGIKQIKDFFGIKGNKKITFTNIDNYVNKMLYDDAYNLRSEEQRQAYFNSTGYDGVILKGQYGDEYVVFNSNQIKNVDNTNPTSNPDIRYSLSVQEANTTQDNEGRKLSDNQLAYFKDSKAVDENGNLVTVYHTMTNTGTQFNEFNPVGTEGYRFGDQVVNFYTNSQVMSDSYANYKSTKADTSKLANIEDAKTWLTKQNTVFDEYNIEKSKGNGYYITSNGQAKQTLQFKNENDLLKNIKQRFYEYNKQFGSSKGQAKYQYEGYVNITNPYIIDAKESNWDEIITGTDDYSVEALENLSDELKEQLTDLAEKSIEFSKNGRSDMVKYSKKMSEIAQNLGGYTKAREISAEFREYERLLDEAKSMLTSQGMLYDDSYFTKNGQELIKQVEDEAKTSFNDIDLFNAATNNFEEESLKNIFSTTSTTNEIIQNVLNQNKNGSNYDGVIIKNVMDYGADGAAFDGDGAAQDVYVTFNSNQFKAVDNLNPTNDADIRYQLGTGEIAPTSGWNVRSEDVRLQSAFKDAIAPIQEQVQELSNTINELKESIPQREYRPLTEQEGEQLAEEYANRDISNEIAPVSENLTEEENQRLAVLDLLERNNMLDEEHQYERDQLLEKANPTIPNEEATPGKALEDIRDIDEVGKRSVKAYQYEHPEVKPYFQEEARKMLSDLDNSYKGFREGRESTKNGEGFNWEWVGAKRITSPEIAELLDSKYGYTYQDIRKGLNAIIEDHGAENIAVAKRIEFILDNRLRNGYDAWGVYDDNGNQYHQAPDYDYLNMLKEQEWENYFEDLNKQYPFELEEVPQYAIEDEETDFSDVKIDKDLQDMTVDDINLEPFLEGLQKASDRQAERQQLREELNQKKEVKIPKETNGRKAWNKFKSLFVNEFAVVDDYAKRHNAPEIKHKTDTWNNYLAAAQYNIENAQTDMNGKAIGRSGNSIFQEAQKLGLKDTFDTYLKHWANVDRAKQGKGANYEAKESYKIVKEMEAKNPELKRLGKDMWQYYRNARHNLRDAGIINQQTSDMLGRMYPHYTPYVSENIENYFTPTGELKPKSTIKRAKGGAVLEGLLSAEEAMQMYTKSQFNTIFGNDVFKSIVNTSNNQVEMVDNRTSYVNADNLYTDKDGYYLTAYENGDAITAKISEEMYKALSRESKTRVQDLENTFRPVGKVLSTLSNIRRNILTSWSPTFIAKNFIKDYQEALFNSKYTADFAKNYPSAFKELATNTGEAQQFKALYGSGLTMGQFDMDSINYNPNAKNFNFLKGIKNANELIELAPRYAEFKASRENGASIQEAMYNAREVTTNFSRGGVITKAFNKYGMTFLNSSVQGFDKFIRNFSGENGAKGVVNSLAKAVIFGIAPAVFNELAFGSGDDKDEEYEAIPDYIKDNYYIIKTGDGNFVRIPKGRVFSVFGSAARRTIEMMEGEENAFDGFLENAQQQIGINNPEENNIFAPFIQAMGGRKLDSGQTAGSAWYGGDIIPSRLQKERPEDQYDASIDKLSIWLGQQTGISPYKINYVLDQYSGGIGDLILPMITDEANSDGSIIAPIKDQFTADSTTDNKYVSEFYDTKGKLYTGSKATDEDKLKNMYMNHISMGMSQLYAERREVQASDLPKKEKYAKSQEIKKEINRFAKIGLDGYNNIEVTGNYAVINDDMGYYKNANGEWKPIPQNDITYTESEGLTDNEKSAYYGLKNDIYNINKEYEDESLNASTEEKRILNAQKKNEIIDTIKSSNLDDNTKAYIYSKKYGDKKIQSFINSGIDVNSYLDYKQQDFSADKDRNGKSISGSKKRKVFDYINSMNIPYEQKLILAKSEYNSFNQNNYDIINYIENSGMSYDERIELYKNLGFKVDGDNISW